MFSTRNRLLAIGGAIAAGLVAISAGVSAAGNTSAQRSQFTYVLCGTFQPANSANPSGNSSVDHPSGATAMGTVEQVSGVPTGGDPCDNSSNGGQFQWTVNHSNVQLDPNNPNYERGTEHGIATINPPSGTFSVGFNGMLTNFDFQESGDPCAGDSDNRVAVYQSGHSTAYTGCQSGASDGPGNINTHGGASVGQHFNGQYGVLVYQESDGSTESDGSNCPTGSQMYCFEAVLVGFTN